MRTYVTASLQHLAEVPHFVYEAWNGDTCLYVGMTYNLRRRMSCHKSRSQWLMAMTRLEVTEVPNRWSAEALESKLITELQPLNNRWRPTVHDDERADEAA